MDTLYEWMRIPRYRAAPASDLMHSQTVGLHLPCSSTMKIWALRRTVNSSAYSKLLRLTGLGLKETVNHAGGLWRICDRGRIL